MHTTLFRQRPRVRKAHAKVNALRKAHAKVNALREAHAKVDPVRAAHPTSEPVRMAHATSPLDTARKHHANGVITPSRAALFAACLCAWTSNAPGGDAASKAHQDLLFGAPLSAEALEATSQASSSMAATARPQTVTTTAPPQLSTPVPQSPTISVTAGRERTLILALPAQPESTSALTPAQVTVVLAPLESNGLFEFNGAPEAEMPEPLVAFEPPTARFDDAAVAAQGALNEIAVASFATAYPAKLEDVPTPVALDAIPAPVPVNDISALAALGQNVQWAAAQPAAFADPVRQRELSFMPVAPFVPAPAIAPLAQDTPRTEGAPQQLANLDNPRRLPGTPLTLTALAQFNAFDASRTMQRFEVTGKSPLPRLLIDNALHAFLGTERDDEQLKAARNALQRAHDMNGHRVKVILGEQRERDGVARLEVRELKRYSLRIAGELRYDPVMRRNVRAEIILDHEEPLTSLTLSRKLSLR